MPDAEGLGDGGDAGVPCDDQQVVQASACTGPDKGAAERFGQVARLDAGRGGGWHVGAGAAGADGNAVVVGEPVQGLEGAVGVRVPVQSQVQVNVQR